MAGQKNVMIVQHFGPPYMDPNNPADKAQMDKMAKAVDAFRAQGGIIIHSPPKGNNPDPKADLMEEARKSPGYKAGDPVVQNYDGNGKSDEFKKMMMDVKADHVVMTGPYFDACNRYTSESIRNLGLGIGVSSPRDLADPGATGAKYDETARQMQEAGIDTQSSSEDIRKKIEAGQPLERIEPNKTQSRVVETVAADADLDGFDPDTYGKTQEPPPPKNGMDEAAKRTQEARQERYVPYTPNQLTEEQRRAMEAIINGLPEPEETPQSHQKLSNAEIADASRKRYKDETVFRDRALEDIDAVHKSNPDFTEEMAAKQRSLAQDEFLKRTSPEALEKATAQTVGADLAESGNVKSPKEYKKQLDQTLEDYKASPEAAAWKKEHEALRAGDIETGKKLSAAAEKTNGPIPDSEPSKALNNAKEGSQRIKSLANGEAVPPRPEPVSVIASEPAAPNAEAPKPNAFDQAHESARKIDEMANPNKASSAMPASPEKKMGAFEQAGRSSDKIKEMSEQYHKDRLEPLAAAQESVTRDGIQKAEAAENVAKAAGLEQKLADAGVKTPPPPPGSVREKVVQGDLEGATNQAAENTAENQQQASSQTPEPVAAAAEPNISAPEAPKAPETPHAPPAPEGGIPRGPSAAATAGDALDAAGLKGKGNLATAGVVGLGVAAYSLAEGASAAEAGKAGLDAANPYAGTLNTALDENATKLDVATVASEETATLAGSTGGALLGAQAFGSAGAVLGPAGAAAGAVIGGIAGGIAGGAAVDATIKHGKEAYDAAVDATSRGIESVANAGSAAMDSAGRAWDGAKSYMFGENKDDISKPTGEESPAPGASANTAPETPKAPDSASSDRSTASASRDDGQGIDAASPKTAFNDNAAGKPSTPESAPEPKPDLVASNEEKYTTSSPSAPAMA